ncbi:MAG: endonuclease domain-containing protein [Rhizobiales bacterium]|nr:endonuclease domain-containing protein [Hyphomicrobiales bacterium]
MITTHSQARSLRNSQTDAEAILWSQLRNRQMAGRKFRRQVPLLAYVVDFASLDAKLIIELDGGQHAEQMEADATRTLALEAEGFIVLRFWNADVFTNLDGVLTAIHAALEPDEYTVL